MIHFDYTFFIVLTGTTLVGITSGIIGCFVILQRQSLFGDTIAHATLPGLAAMFLYTNSKNPTYLFIGAIISAILSAWCITIINKHSTLKKETALGIILATTFGIGTVLLSIIQSCPNAQKAGINKFLLGNPSTLLFPELIIISIIAFIVIATTIACWKEFKIFVFNQEFAHAIGIQTNITNLILNLLTISTIIIGLQTVGVVLISSLLIAPACASYQWSNKLSSMIFISCLFSCIATIGGTIISSNYSHIPTGPMIIIIATSCTFFSILFAHQNGLIMSFFKKLNQKKQIDDHKMLTHFMLFNESKTDPFHAHDLNALQAIGKKSTNKTLFSLAQKNLIENSRSNFWRLTPKGFHLAQKLYEQKQGSKIS